VVSVIWLGPMSVTTCGQMATSCVVVGVHGRPGSGWQPGNGWRVTFRLTCTSTSELPSALRSNNWLTPRKLVGSNQYVQLVFAPPQPTDAPCSTTARSLPNPKPAPWRSISRAANCEPTG
jgi:hypothetical protein